jgi:hypothetical protein
MLPPELDGARVMRPGRIFCTCCIKISLLLDYFQALFF